MENATYRILLIEDDELDQMAFKRHLKAENLPYEYVVVPSISEAQSVLSSETFDIILTDFTLGDGTALDILDSVKDIPIVLTTGARDEDVAVKAWKAGAYDYLSKDFERNYLRAIPKTIENAIRRRKIEEALDKKQKNLEAIFDAVPIGMFLVDENMSIARANDSIRKMFQRDFSQIISRRIGDALGCSNHINSDKGCGYTPACPGCSFRKTIQGVLDSERSIYGLEIRPTLTINDKEIQPWFRISAKPVKIDNNRHVIVAIDDVTERKKAENERLLAEEKYRMIFENSAAAITLVDEQERLISWNKFTEGILGMDGEELYLLPVRSLYPPGEWDRNLRCKAKGNAASSRNQNDEKGRQFNRR